MGQIDLTAMCNHNAIGRDDSETQDKSAAALRNNHEEVTGWAMLGTQYSTVLRGAPSGNIQQQQQRHRST